MTNAFNINDFQERLCDVAAAWLKIQDRIDPFYKRKVDNRRLLTPNEISAAFHIAEMHPGCTVVEIGCGLGQMAALMDALDANLTVKAVEGSRVKGARYLRDGIKGEYELIFDSYPRGIEAADLNADVLVTGNIASNFWRNWGIPEKEKYEAFFGDISSVVIDARLWWNTREDPQDRINLAHSISELTNRRSKHLSSTIWEFTI